MVTAFVVIYVAAAVLVAIPILIGELAIGRRGRHSPPRTRLSDGPAQQLPAYAS